MAVIRPSAKFGSMPPGSTSKAGSAMATSGETAPTAVAVTTVVAVPSTALVRNRRRSRESSISALLLAVHGHGGEPAGQAADRAERGGGEVEDPVGGAGAAAATRALAAPEVRVRPAV